VDQTTMRTLAGSARVARIGTTDHHGNVHLVPVTFVLRDDIWYSPSDASPPLAERSRKIARDPRATVLIDEYDEDWGRVWWVRLRGRGRILEDGPEREGARRMLLEKYPQFVEMSPEEGLGVVLAVDVAEWAAWSYSS